MSREIIQSMVADLEACTEQLRISETSTKKMKEEQRVIKNRLDELLRDELDYDEAVIIGETVYAFDSSDDTIKEYTLRKLQ